MRLEANSAIPIREAGSRLSGGYEHGRDTYERKRICECAPGLAVGKRRPHSAGAESTCDSTGAGRQLDASGIRRRHRSGIDPDRLTAAVPELAASVLDDE